jgi:hypothetical protein
MFVITEEMRERQREVEREAKRPVKFPRNVMHGHEPTPGSGGELCPDYPPVIRSLVALRQQLHAALSVAWSAGLDDLAEFYTGLDVAVSERKMQYYGGTNFDGPELLHMVKHGLADAEGKLPN